MSNYDWFQTCWMFPKTCRQWSAIGSSAHCQSFIFTVIHCWGFSYSASHWITTPTFVSKSEPANPLILLTVEILVRLRHASLEPCLQGGQDSLSSPTVRPYTRFHFRFRFQTFSLLIPQTLSEHTFHLRLRRPYCSFSHARGRA